MGGEIPINQIIHGDCKNVLKTLPDNSVDSIVTDPPYELGFIGKKWDKQKITYDISMWRQCLRVLKPGGNLLSFGGSRTFHRMAVTIEDAGFEIRDCIVWAYGSGFPKSLNIGKAVDKIQGNERTNIGSEIRYNEPSGIVNIGQGERKLIKRIITKGFSKWGGWGTALKPAVEFITLARKPLSEKNVAKNVLKWGTGGLNIDECRIPTNDMLNGGGTIDKKNYFTVTLPSQKIRNRKGAEIGGRFPANLIHDGSEEVKKLFPESNFRFFQSCPFTEEDYLPIFYCPKASKKERNEGLKKIINKHPTVKPLKLIEYLVKLVTPKNGIVLDPFIGSGTTAVACIKLDRNFIGIELEKDYVEIANKRIEYYMKKKQGELFFNIKS